MSLSHPTHRSPVAGRIEPPLWRRIRNATWSVLDTASEWFFAASGVAALFVGLALIFISVAAQLLLPVIIVVGGLMLLYQFVV
jgi:hypothetical protein